MGLAPEGRRLTMARHGNIQRLLEDVKAAGMPEQYITMIHEALVPHNERVRRAHALFKEAGWRWDGIFEGWKAPDGWEHPLDQSRSWVIERVKANGAMPPGLPNVARYTTPITAA